MGPLTHTPASTMPLTPPHRWIPSRTMALRIAGAYAVLGALWILGSGWLLDELVRDPDLRGILETMKGWLFVAVTATLLGWALSRYFNEIRRSAQQLQQSEERWQFALEGSGDGVWDWNAQTNEVFFSPRWKAMLGFQPHEIGNTITEWETRVHPEDLPHVRSEVQRHLDGLTPDYANEHRMRCKDGSFRWVLDRGKVMSRTPDGRPLRVLGTHTDITARKQLESRLRQSQKLEAIGQLAGGIAHDFNNILAATMMNLGLLQMNPNLDEPTRNALRELDADARRAANLTRQLLMFSRRSVLAIRPLDLNEVVANLLRMLRRLIGEHLDLRFENADGLPKVAADAGMLEQILMNLVVNARDAMPHGGRITISTSPAAFDDAQAAVHHERRPGHFVCLAVSDTGSGMDAETLKRLFEPFFTTKPAGEGTGLGLATVHGLAAQHNGWVEVESTVGQGTTFRVFFPVTTHPPATPTPSPQPTPAPRASETVPLVQNEAPPSPA